MYKYSASTGGFYVTDLHPNIPADAVDITDAEHASLIKGQEQGKVIAPGQDGRPILTDPLTPKVHAVSRRQAKLALLEAGLLDHVDTAIDALSGDEKKRAQIDWSDATMFERTSPVLVALAPALGLDDAALDDLFAHAATL